MNFMNRNYEILEKNTVEKKKEDYSHNHTYIIKKKIYSPLYINYCNFLICDYKILLKCTICKKTKIIRVNENKFNLLKEKEIYVK